MRICIPTIGKRGLEDEISPHFGSAPTFTIVDTDTALLDIIMNDNEHHEHGNCHPLSKLEGRAVDAVVCGGMGRKAVTGLNAGGIKAYLCSHGTVADVIREFKAGTIIELTQDSACGGHGCH